MACRLYGIIWANVDALSIETLGISLNQNIIISIQENEYAYIVCKTVPILCPPQVVTTITISYMTLAPEIGISGRDE